MTCGSIFLCQKMNKNKIRVLLLHQNPKKICFLYPEDVKSNHWSMQKRFSSEDSCNVYFLVQTCRIDPTSFTTTSNTNKYHSNHKKK